jgi:hypothetical protein
LTNRMKCLVPSARRLHLWFRKVTAGSSHVHSLVSM